MRVGSALCLGPFLGFGLILGLSAMPGGAVLAQGALSPPPATPAPSRPVDPLFAPAEKAFLALDLEARKAIQRDLVWAAGFTGAATGDFGPLTFAALKRYETESKAKVDAILSPPERAALQKAADSARAGAKFEVVTDKASGMRLGVPQALLVKATPNASGGTRFQDKDEKVTVETVQHKPEDQLADLFEKGIAERPGRKITYKLMRPDFFVIAGETQAGKFYRRVESDGKALRGLAIGYDKSLASAFDRQVIAIVSTFEAFPRAGGARPQPGAGPVPVASGPRQRRATGVQIGPEVIVTSDAALKACAEIVALGPKGERVALRRAKSTAAGLLVLAGKAGAPLSTGIAAVGPGAATLLQREVEGDLAASAATLADGKAEASLQEGGAGAALFDHQGRLIGVIAAEPVTKYKVAGIVPALRYAYLAAADVFAEAGVAPPAGGAAAPRSAAAIAESVRGALLPLLCASDR